MANGEWKIANGRERRAVSLCAPKQNADDADGADDTDFLRAFAFSLGALGVSLLAPLASLLAPLALNNTSRPPRDGRENPRYHPCWPRAARSPLVAPTGRWPMGSPDNAGAAARATRASGEDNALAFASLRPSTSALANAPRASAQDAPKRFALAVHPGGSGGNFGSLSPRAGCSLRPPLSGGCRGPTFLRRRRWLNCARKRPAVKG